MFWVKRFEEAVFYCDPIFLVGLENFQAVPPGLGQTSEDAG